MKSINKHLCQRRKDLGEKKHQGLETLLSIYLCMIRRIIDISESTCLRLFSGWGAPALGSGGRLQTGWIVTSLF
jgi:hypothetical protein